jgi:tight adherence protein B
MAPISAEQIIFMLVAFVALTTIALAVGMLLNDLFFRKREAVDESLPSLPPKIPSDTAIDRAFFRLVQESGSRLEPAAAVSVVIGSAVVGGAAGLIVFEHLLLGAVGILLGIIVPLTAWGVIRWRRMSNMRKHLPETLSIVADAVRAGHTLEEASAFVRKDIKGPLADEFAYAEKQFSLGQTPAAVLSTMVRRIPLPEFRLFATAVLVHRKAGGNLPLLTERLANTARARQEVHNHMMAVTAGSRLSAIGMVFGSVVAMSMLAWLEPEYLRAFVHHEMGPTLIMLALTLQLIGVVWVWRILRVSY